MALAIVLWLCWVKMSAKNATLVGLIVWLFASSLGCSQVDPLPNTATEDVAIRSPSALQSESSLRSHSTTTNFSALALSSALAPQGKFAIRLNDVAAELGVQFQYDNGAQGQALMVEATGGGAGWLDYDRDGNLDLFFNQGGKTTGTPSAPDMLFRNDGICFSPVGPVSGLNDNEYSQGVAIADFDNDGFDDVYLTSIRHNWLFKNQGDGTFLNVTDETGMNKPRWSSSATWGDLDRDGDLDLYVCNYLEFDADHPRICHRVASGLPAMCHPRDFPPIPDECFENLGDGTFRQVAQDWGLHGPGNRALGVAIADFNNDGRLDVFVANDTTANFLFVNQGDGKFLESAMLLGCGLNAQGAAQANMGVAVGDYDGNGFLDLYLTHFSGEWNTLYRNLGEEGFQDRTALVGLVAPTMSKLAFGTVMTDFDQDGKVELFVANGHIDPNSEDGDGYEMEPQIFTQSGSRFVDCSQTAGDYFQRKLVGRGVALGDFDNDGDWDLAVVHHNSPASVLRNDSARGDWLKLRAIGRSSSRTPIGLRVTLRQGMSKQMQELVGGSSYCSAHEDALIFGVGRSSEPCVLEVRWPSGRLQQLENVSLNRTLTLLEPLE